MPSHAPFLGLVPAALTPLDSAGNLNLSVVERQADLFVHDGVTAAFICGTTGEFSSLTPEERLALTARWAAVLKGTSVRLIIHVGANCLADSRQFAAHAQAHGAAAIAMLSPSYFKPRSAEVLIACCAEVAASAPQTPFYFYDIPALTGVSFPVAEWVEAAADRIPTFAGVKFTNPDLMTYQRLLRAGGGRFDVLFGMDEQLLAAIALGGHGAVGSGYNFAAMLFHEVFDLASRGDYETARARQFQAVELIAVMIRHGYLPAAKELMRMRGVDLGPLRLPLVSLTPAQVTAFQGEIERLDVEQFWAGKR